MHLSVIELARIPLRGATQLFRRRRTKWGFETTSNQSLAPSTPIAIIFTWIYPWTSIENLKI